MFPACEAGKNTPERCHGNHKRGSCQEGPDAW